VSLGAIELNQRRNNIKQKAKASQAGGFFVKGQIEALGYGRYRDNTAAY
jgi:hypothetical protein